MRTLPLDFYRCAPAEPDSFCRQCLRWAYLPGQTWGLRTPIFSPDEECRYYPIAKEPDEPPRS